MPPRNDLTGQRFGRLLVLCDTGRRSGSAVIWRCQCDCGNVVDVPARNLRSRSTVSCGCNRRKQSKENLNSMPAFEKFGQYDDTNISRIRSDKLPRNNTSGVRGVHYNGHSYEAYIYVQRSRIRLGCYPTLDEARAAREEAEKAYFAPLIADYDAKIIPKKEQTK